MRIQIRIAVIVVIKKFQTPPLNKRVACPISPGLLRMWVLLILVKTENSVDIRYKKICQPSPSKSAESTPFLSAVRLNHCRQLPTTKLLPRTSVAFIYEEGCQSIRLATNRSIKPSLLTSVATTPNDLPRAAMPKPDLPKTFPRRRYYCVPRVFKPRPSFLFITKAGEVFDASQASGIAASLGKSFGAVATDVNNDG